MNEGRLKRWEFEPHNDGTDKGRVVVYSLPSFVHEATAGCISSSVIEQIQMAGNEITLIRTVHLMPSTCWTGDRGQKPNIRIIPVGLRVGGAVLSATRNRPYPNIVVEVAYKNNSLQRLRVKIERWMQATSVQVAIGIKIFASSERRVAIIHQRGREEPVTIVEFGHPNPGPVQLSFPLASVYTGVPLPVGLTSASDTEISIDLIALREIIADPIQCLGVAS
ncbi:hypothetical protein LEN26_008539 [Aphanomyces euteiches]|nr:hypothetical protein LEN26_008539 [Aphanomyces euteiches]